MGTPFTMMSKYEHCMQRGGREQDVKECDETHGYNEQEDPSKKMARELLVRQRRRYSPVTMTTNFSLVKASYYFNVV